MRGLLDRSLLVVTGKGGVGKTTVAAALGVLGARAGRRTIVVEVGEQTRLPVLFGRPPAEAGSPTTLDHDLSSISIDPDRALLEWLQTLGGRVSGRVLASSGTFQYFAAAAPGAKELVSMVKIARLARAPRRTRAAGPLVILDAPATGHALGMLRSPETFGSIARVGPIARQARELLALLRDEDRTAYVGVALGTEMAVTEVLELQAGLGDALGRELATVVVNALLPRRFSAAELTRIEQALAAGQDRVTQPVLEAAARAAREVHDRAGFQHGQLARLRRRGVPALPLPFHWGSELDLEALEALCERLQRGLERAENGDG